MLSNEIDRVFSVVCQKQNLAPETINKIKAFYGEAYFGLMSINYFDYLKDTFPSEYSLDNRDRQITPWMLPINLKERLLVAFLLRSLCLCTPT